MTYSMYLSLTLATLRQPTLDPAAPLPPDLNTALQPLLDALRASVEAFRHGPVTPARTARFEDDVQQHLRQLGQAIVHWTYNQVEPAAVPQLPAHLRFQGSMFRRLARKTPQTVSTLFGNVTVYRLGYRAAPTEGEPVLFPLCQELGLIHGVTPALLQRVARYQAESGATQKQTLARLRHEHGLSMSVKRLRQVTAWLADALEPHRAAAQAEQVLRWLTHAQAARGAYRPVLGVGRDGITLGLRYQKCTVYEVASTGTITVYDRRGRRLGTVYLARVPESGQGTLSTQLTEVLTEVLRRWGGPLPRLCYVTDAGDNETAYYRQVLRRMRHPVTGRKLEWIWVVDYYHAAQRLSTMAEALFGAGPQAWGWVRKMQKLLLKPGGVGRVLHSAAALRSRRPLGRPAQTEFGKAYRYLQSRRRHLRYADYRRLRLPIGSGVTEAACKTVFTQRLKLSGMRWKTAGAQTILRLRVLLLSGVWSEVFGRLWRTPPGIEIRTSEQPKHATPAIPA
jgi:hypothetical protein